ncbi:FtsQ-type POTRA domain-containing protein [Candidatus Parcubacteria bacterium]|nr:MAG: FtsQ-type POTRA domain-containing protein [Candidatus Parcubacteria bacterium]
MARKDYLASSRKIRRKRLILRVSFYALAAILFCASAVAFFNIEYLKVDNVAVEGNKFVSEGELNLAVLKKLEGNIFLFIPKSNVFLIPKKEIEKDLPAEIKRIKEIYLDGDLPDKLKVKIVERENKALFCHEEDCAFIDEEAFVFEKAPYFSGAIFIKFFDERGSASSSPVVIGSYFLKQEEFDTLMSFSELAAKNGFEVTEIYLKPENIYELATKEGWKMVLNDRNEPEKTFANLVTTLESSVKEKRKNLDYIDLRFGNKIYFKYF